MKELDIIAKNKNPKVIAICETKAKNLSSDPLEAEYQLEGYELFINNLSRGKGRGVAIYVHKSINAKTFEMENKIEDSLWLEVKMNNNDNLVIGCIYRSPSSGRNENKLFLDMMAGIKDIHCTHLMILGDFNMRNIAWPEWESPSPNPDDLENKFIEIMRDNFLFQHINQPTRGRGSDTPTTIDLLFTNEEGMASEVEILSPLGKSDHACISFRFNCYLDTRNTTYSKFMYDKGDYEAIREEMNINWEVELEKRKTINEKWNFIKKKD